jgi:hypothetical protein
MTDMQTASALREALGGHTSGRGHRYDTKLKARAIAFARELRGQGRSWGGIAQELGLRMETVRRWCTSAEPKQMRTVRLQPEPSEARITAVSPSGLRIEGLTLETVVALLRALG